MRGQALEVLRDALLACFDEGELRELVGTRLGVDLAHVAGGSSDLREAVWNLITWAERTGRLVDLIQAAATERPQEANWTRMAVMASQPPQPVERVRMSYDLNVWQRVEEKLDKLAAEVAQQNARLSVVEANLTNLSRRDDRPNTALSSGLVWAALLVLGGLIGAGLIFAARMP